MILSDLLTTPDAYSWGDALYARKASPLAADTPCLVHDPDDVEDDEVDLPNAVIAAGFDHVIDVQTIQSIVANAAAQGRGADLADRVAALNFYLRNDAFIDFGAAE